MDTNSDEKVTMINGLLSDYYANGYRTGDGEIKGYDNGHEITTETGLIQAYMRAIDDIVKRDIKSVAKDGVILRMDKPIDVAAVFKHIDTIIKQTRAASVKKDGR